MQAMRSATALRRAEEAAAYGIEHLDHGHDAMHWQRRSTRVQLDDKAPSFRVGSPGLSGDFRDRPYGEDEEPVHGSLSDRSSPTLRLSRGSGSVSDKHLKVADGEHNCSSVQKHWDSSEWTSGRNSAYEAAEMDELMIRKQQEADRGFLLHVFGIGKNPLGGGLTQSSKLIHPSSPFLLAVLIISALFQVGAHCDKPNSCWH